MLIVMIDRGNPQYVDFPEAEQDILKLARFYLDKEGALPADQQLLAPSFETVQTAFNNAQHWVTENQKQEGIRSTASQQAKQTMAQLKKEMKRAIATLKLHYMDELARLELWGVNTVLTSRGISVRNPIRKHEWLTLVQRYMEREESLMPANRITAPTLEQVQILYTRLQNQYTIRDEAFQARQIAVAKKNNALAELLDLLKTAAAVLVVTRFHRRVTQGLEDWGYGVIVKKKKQPHDNS